MAYISFQPSDYFNWTNYTGNSGTNEQTVGFQPDLTWIKRTDGTYNHYLFDAVRGVTKEINSNTNEIDTTLANSLTAWGATSFTLGSEGQTNTSSDKFASWNWKAGTTSGISGSPSITPTSYSFNATAGFSIIKYDGTGSAATLPHGLGVAPNFIMVKRLDAASSWRVYHVDMGATKSMQLDTNDPISTNSGSWNDTEPTSTLFTVGTANETNNSSGTYVAYCFTNKQGYFKAGKYIGNGVTGLGTFTYLGFRPTFLIYKNLSGSHGWRIHRWNSRGPSADVEGGTTQPRNLCNYFMTCDTTTAEATSGAGSLDMFSNGFQLRHSASVGNGAGEEYIYMAWAAEPLVSSNDIPTLGN